STIYATTAALSMSDGSSGSASVAVAAAVAKAENSTSSITPAALDGSTISSIVGLIPNHNVTVTADDTSEINSDVFAVAASASVSGSASISFDVAVSLSDNAIGSTTLAEIKNSNVTAGDGAVEVKATAETM